MSRAFFSLFLCLCLHVPVLAAVLPEPMPELYVHDVSHVLSEATRNRILEEARALEKACGAQIAVLVVPDLGGNDIRSFSHDVASAWKLGDAARDNGILVLLSVQDRKIRVEVGQGLEGCLPDARVGRLLDTYAVPAFRKNDFDAGIAALFAALADVVRAEYGLSTKGTGAEADTEWMETEGEWWEILLGLVILFSFPVLLLLVAAFCLGIVIDVVSLLFFKTWRRRNRLMKHFFLKRWFLLGWSVVAFFFRGSESSHQGSSWSSGSSDSDTSGGGGSFGGGGSDRSF